MNYYITHCDKKFLKYAERLFETLSFFSQNKIIFYTIDFDYKSKFNNVISIKLNSKKFFKETFDVSPNDDEAYKAYHVFLKPFVVKDCLQRYNNQENNFCYLDSDCLALINCDEIFKKKTDIDTYPLFNKSCHDFMVKDGKGDPFVNKECDLNLCLEAKLMALLGVDLNSRKNYIQTGVFLFNKKCSDFINDWCDTCNKSEIIKNWKEIAPFHEETVVNCLLWKNGLDKNLAQSLINLPYYTNNNDLSLRKIKEMLLCLENATTDSYFIDTFCLIPAKSELKNLFFYHGKISDVEYDMLKENSRENYLIKVNSQSLGDTLASTPTIRKLFKSYNKKIDIITHHPELFYKNKYINKVYSFSENLNEKNYKEVFNTFLGTGGEKNKYGVEKKHNTIDIRQYHALDLGFTLNDKEMEYDYIPEHYVNIEDIPDEYVCLHVANTWPSRTYSDENWQRLIDELNANNLYVVLIGKNGSETGFFNVDKPTKKLQFKKGVDLTNKLNLSQCWHIINKSKFFITMDSGLLHLAGTTDAFIIQLGSSINNKLRAPFRKNSQSYKYKYISGPCEIFCASDIKYGVKEWKTIQGIPPLISCLENKTSFECHPNPKQVCDFILHFNTTENAQVKNKFLFIAPHLSTGGSPKYLEWLISKKMQEGFQVKVIEWNLYSDTFVVQRKAIIDMIGVDNFYSVGYYAEDEDAFNKKTENVINYITEFNPDYIHLNEFSEHFALRNFSNNLIQFLYHKNRKYKIFETTHSSKSDILNKKNIPDELWLVSDYQISIAKKSNIPSKLVEMAIDKKVRPNRFETLKSLDLDPNKLHVLQVGLFTKNKNQKFTFDVASKFKNDNVEFHFIGNKCYIDECDVDTSLSNCRVWGERSDVETFMSCMDVFVMPSFEELNPIALKEALAWNMKCFVSEIETIKEQYTNNENVVFLNQNNFVDYIKNNLKNFKPIQSFNISSNRSEPNKINCTFVPNPKVEITGDVHVLYRIKFVDDNTGKTHFESIINTNMWTACGTTYFCNWKIIVYNFKLGIETIIRLDLKDKKVRIVNESGSLGDAIAWMPAVDEFQKINNCKVDYYTPRKFLFANEYKNINFFDYSDQCDESYYIEYKIGCFDKSADKNKIKVDWREQSLQQIAFTALGLEWSESKTKISVPNAFKNNFNKYVCIATQSTSQSRYWNLKGGWSKTISYLKSLGYTVVCVDKHYQYGNADHINTCPDNVDYFVGDKSFEEIIDIINGCEFFIGLSSGLSWLAWALNKKIIKINSSVTPEFEFYTPYLVTNKNVCNGCFNNKKYHFDSSNWSWCPENKNFECSTNISSEHLIEKINILISDSKKKFKYKIVHLQTTINTENEIKSRNFIKKFNNYDIIYVNHQNVIDTTDEYKNNCLYPGLLNSEGADKLNSRHFGCFSSYKKAILQEFTDDIDFLIICEGDCLFEVEYKEFVKILERVSLVCESNNINYFSFGDTRTLESNVLQSNCISIPENQNDCFICDKIIGIQCVMFSKKIKNILISDFKNQPWYVADGWFNEFCWRNDIKMGILNERVTTQYSGESFIDNKIKNFLK